MFSQLGAPGILSDRLMKICLCVNMFCVFVYVTECMCEWNKGLLAELLLAQNSSLYDLLKPVTQSNDSIQAAV